MREETPPSAEPGPLNTTGARKTGGVPGVSITVTDAKREANRTQNWRTGRYAKHVTQYEADKAALTKQFGEGADDVMEAYAGHILAGESEGADVIAVRSLATTELVRRKAAEAIHEHGVTITEDLVDKKGDVVSSRVIVNPAAKLMLDAAGVLGHTAADRLLTPKSRNEGERDAAIVAMEMRDRLLRSGPKDRLAPPPPTVETTASPSGDRL